MEQIRPAVGSHGGAGTLINSTGSFREARGCISVAVDCRQVIAERLELPAPAGSLCVPSRKISWLEKMAGNRAVGSPGLSRIVGNTLSLIGILPEQLNEKTLDGTCGAGVAESVICDSGKVRSGFVRKAVHRTTVDDELPVSTSVVHFLNERADLCHWYMRIQGTVTHEDFCPSHSRLKWLGRVKATVDTDYSGDLGAAAHQLEYGHPAKAVAHRCDTPINLPMGSHYVHPRACALAQLRDVMTQFRDSSHDALPVPDHAVAVHVAGKYDQAQSGQLDCPPFGVVVKASTAMDNQDARPLAVPVIIPRQKPRELCIPIAIPNCLRTDAHVLILSRSGHMPCTTRFHEEPARTVRSSKLLI
jgi:hypothetical protein